MSHSFYKSKILLEWKKNSTTVYVYTVGVRLNGKITDIDTDHLVLDNRTPVNYTNIVSITDIEQLSPVKPSKK